MLILARRIGESITIGNNITVTVVKIDRGRVTIGIAAPKEEKILRSELERRGEAA